MTRRAILLPFGTLRRCSLTGCNNQAVAQTSPFQTLCKTHLQLYSLARVEIEEHERTSKLPDPIESLEPDHVIRDIERLGLENYDPETDKPKDAGKWMHQKRSRH